MQQQQWNGNYLGLMITLAHVPNQLIFPLNLHRMRTKHRHIVTILIFSYRSQAFITLEVLHRLL